jgi:hypothetical protein
MQEQVIEFPYLCLEKNGSGIYRDVHFPENSSKKVLGFQK